MRTCHLIGWPDVRDVPVHIYGLKDPRDGRVRYVGRSQNPKGRIASHRSRSGAPAVREFLRQLASEGLKPELVILHTVKPGEDADPWEEKFILELNAAGQLLNKHTRAAGISPRHLRTRAGAERLALQVGHKAGELQNSVLRATANGEVDEDERRSIACHVSELDEVVHAAARAAKQGAR